MTLKNLEESRSESTSGHREVVLGLGGVNSKARRSSEVRTPHPQSCTATQGLTEPPGPPTLLPEIVTTGQSQEEPKKDTDEFLSCF